MGRDQEAGPPGTEDTAAGLTGLEFHRLDPQRVEDLLTYLGGEGFADNPHWRDCFCFYYHFGGEGSAWRARTGAQNRADKAARVVEGRAHGVIAYRAGEVVGWVHAGPYGELDALVEEARPGAGAIVCYVVHPRHRRQGLGSRLLEEACGMLADLGLDSVDAWPLRQVQADDVLPTSALIYHGTRSMYERAGFTEVADGRGGAFVHVRKRLR